MKTLPYPAIVVTHTFQVQPANTFFLRILELLPLETLPQHQRSMMHFLFTQDHHGEPHQYEQELPYGYSGIDAMA